ncbi:hypothetical protein AYO44_13735 [Planctomycetaceae bacterium SCGC AG-212-F19]|nr:hypothetical protein AYO44_13735 [Planctomycetaceae bacterium SCGC AG-212-F19]
MNESTTPPIAIHRTGRRPNPLVLDPTDAAHLEEIATNSFWPDHQARKAKAILAITNGGRVCDISAQLGISPPTLWRYRNRLLKGGVAGLLIDKHPTGRPPLNRQPEKHLDRLQLDSSPLTTARVARAMKRTKPTGPL